MESDFAELCDVGRNFSLCGPQISHLLNENYDNDKYITVITRRLNKSLNLEMCTMYIVIPLNISPCL